MCQVPHLSLIAHIKSQQRQRTVLGSRYSVLFDGFAVPHRASAGVLLAGNFSVSDGQVFREDINSLWLAIYVRYSL